jgi:hypothetical protein
MKKAWWRIENYRVIEIYYAAMKKAFGFGTTFAMDYINRFFQPYLEE